MDSKKVNLMAVVIAVIMCVFTIFISTKNLKGESGADGKNGSDMTISTLYEAYKEQNPTYTGTLTEFIDYYISGKDGKDGKDGEDFAISAVYEEYKQLNPTYEGSLAQFIEDFLGNKISFVDEISKAQLSAQSALCSTVDICFSYYMDTYYSASESTATIGGQNKDIYFVSKSSQPLMSVSAGSGVIYKMMQEGTKQTAYLITNYHVVYVEGYSNDSNYEVFQKSDGTYFTRKKDDSKFYNYGFYNYIIDDEIEEAPVSVHFLDSYKVYLNGYQSKSAALSAELVGGSAENDIAVLKIEYDSAVDSNNNNKLIFEEPYSSVTLGDSDDIHELDYVIPVGNPLIPNTSDIDMSKITTYEQYLVAIEEAYINSLCLTTTGGRISQITCEMPFGSIVDDLKINNMRLIQVDAAINPGNSGGGLYDIDGKLIGIVNGKIVDTNYDNVGFAIPINIASRIADQIISQCDGNDNLSIYKVDVEKIGLKLGETVGEENKPEFDVVWNYAYDIVVEQISPLSLASADFKVGDIIKAVKFENDSEYRKIVREYQLDDLLLLTKYPPSDGETMVSFKIIRNGNEMVLNINFKASIFEKII